MPDASAQFAIDIAATMSGGDQTQDELDALTARLSASGAKAGHFDKALAQTSRALEDAAMKTREAAAAVSASSERYRDYERAANQAADAVDRYDRAAAQIARLTGAADRATAKAAAMAEQLGRSKAAADAAAGSVAAAQSRLDGLASAADRDASALASSRAELERLQAAANAAAVKVAADAQSLAVLERAADKAGAKASKAAAQIAHLAPDDLRAKASSAAAALDAESESLKRLRAEAEAASASQTKLAKTAKNLRTLQSHVNDKLGDATTNLATFRGALGDVGGPLGELGERALFPAQAFVDLNEKFGKFTAIATVSVVGIAAVTAALVALGVAGVAAAVKLGDTARSAALAAEAFDAMNPKIAKLREQFAGLEGETGVAASRLQDVAKKLDAAGVSAANMPGALRAAAMAEAALGQGGADEFIARMKASNRSVAAFSAETEKKLGGIVQRQMLGLEAQGNRMRTNLGKIFGSLDIEPALKGLRTLVGLFDENTAAGRAIKFMFKTIFQPLIDQAENAALVVKAFALGVLIELTKLYIAVKPAIKTLAELFGFEDFTLKDVLDITKKAGEWFVDALVVLAGVVGVVVVGLGTLGAALLAIPVGIVVLLANLGKLSDYLVGLAANVIKYIVETFDMATEFLQGVSWGEIGSLMINGLIAGIQGAAGGVVKAVTGTVGGAIDAAKKMLGIASPSKVFSAMGTNVGESFAGATEAEAPAAQAAMSDLVAPPPAPEIPAPMVPDFAASQIAALAPMAASFDQRLAEMPLPTGGAIPAGGTFDERLLAKAQAPAERSPTVAPTPPSGERFAGATFNFYGVEGAEDAVARFEDMLRAALEGDAASLGGALA